jgi:hypothetical protein
MEKIVFYMPVWKGNLNLAISTAESLHQHEKETPIIFSNEENEEEVLLEQHGRVLYGGERGWGNAGKRFFSQMEGLVREGVEVIIKLDPDAYCVKRGAVERVLTMIGDFPVIGNTLKFSKYDIETRRAITTCNISLGGIVAMRCDLIQALSYEEFYKTEDFTRSRFLERLGIEVQPVPEILCQYNAEVLEAGKACLVHPYITKRGKVKVYKYGI